MRVSWVPRCLGACTMLQMKEWRNSQRWRRRRRRLRRMGPKRTKLACHQSKFNRDSRKVGTWQPWQEHRRRRSRWRLRIKQFHFSYLQRYILCCATLTQYHRSNIRRRKRDSSRDERFLLVHINIWSNLAVFYCLVPRCTWQVHESVHSSLTHTHMRMASEHFHYLSISTVSRFIFDVCAHTPHTHTQTMSRTTNEFKSSGQIENAKFFASLSSVSSSKFVSFLRSYLVSLFFNKWQ